nr:PREDICTED: probable disease resistance protein At1g59620 isoform X2 [Daucus carota subsp. sativus]
MEKEIDQLVSDLMKKDENFEVVSLWGMGGQGKTTLAQKLYNHVKIRDHFKAFAWVCISQQFDREKVLKGILKQLLPDDRKGEVSNMEDPDLVDGLRRVQLEKKCLIVIDDIWNNDSWRMLQPAFPLGETTSGCKILLTTRNLTVAEIGSVCKIPGLTEDEGWQLLSRKTRIYDQPERSTPFDNKNETAKEIVEKIMSLPVGDRIWPNCLGRPIRNSSPVDVDEFIRKMEADERALGKQASKTVAARTRSRAVAVASRMSSTPQTVSSDSLESPKTEKGLEASSSRLFAKEFKLSGIKPPSISTKDMFVKRARDEKSIGTSSSKAPALLSPSLSPEAKKMKVATPSAATNT